MDAARLLSDEGFNVLHIQDVDARFRLERPRDPRWRDAMANDAILQLGAIVGAVVLTFDSDFIGHMHDGVPNMGVVRIRPDASGIDVHAALVEVALSVLTPSPGLLTVIRGVGRGRLRVSQRRYTA